MTDTATPEVNTRRLTPAETASGINLRLHTEGDGTSTFVEIEDDHGRSIKVGAVTHGEDGNWSIRITAADIRALVDQPGSARPRLLVGYTVPDHVRWSAFGRAVDVSCLTDACRLNDTARRFLVPALGDATEVIDWLKEHAHGAEVVEYRSAPAAERTLTLPDDWRDQLRAIHQHELTGGERGLAIARAISTIANWLGSPGGAR